ncbi:MAG: right-handed parallel beta-helix repeat-containing protein [Gammaproteobacteria bacterium]|nr:right-handed parallel beta-helix repeat-containing protein [Gammaproteobacteria bacterium]
MTHGSFIITNKANLTVNNSIIKGTLSNDNRVLINIDDGSANLSNNNVNLHAVGIDPHPKTQSLDYFMTVALGSVNLDSNHFAIAEPMAAGFMITTSTIPTTKIKVTNNTFKGFHGVLYLINSDNAVVKDNTLDTNTYGNIVIVGNDGQVIHNTIYFSGNNHLGNSIDLINANNVIVSKNILLTPTCHGIYVINSHNLKINDNRISGGITYAMNIYSYPESDKKIEMDDYISQILTKLKSNSSLSSDVTISNNYMSQNRYGIAASDMSGLTITNNYFVQRFADNDARKFWTDNSILLANVKNLIWSNNFYKEAFTQQNGGDNTKSFKLLPFPVTGGVTL